MVDVARYAELAFFDCKFKTVYMRQQNFDIVKAATTVYGFVFVCKQMIPEFAVIGSHNLISAENDGFVEFSDVWSMRNDSF